MILSRTNYKVCAVILLIVSLLFRASFARSYMARNALIRLNNNNTPEHTEQLLFQKATVTGLWYSKLFP